MFWEIRDCIRDAHLKMRVHMEKIERKILNKVLNGNKRRVVCFIKYPVDNVFDHPKANFIYKEREEKCAYQIVSKVRSAPDFLEEKEIVYYYPEYIASFSHAEVIPCTDTIIKDGVMLSDRFEFDKHFATTLLMRRIACDKENIVMKVRRTEYLKGEYIDLCYAGGGNIWHMTHWMLAKMQLINSCDALKNIPLLVDEHIKTNDFAKEYIGYFNTDKHKILYLKRDRLYHVEKVYVISGSASFLYLDQRHPNKWVAVFSKNFVPYARSVMPERLYKTDLKKKIFIKRRDQRLINQDEVIAYLRPKGFEIIQPERYSFIDELSLFYNAECIVGATGAGLANILYAPKECNVICIASKERIYDAMANATVVQDVGTKVYYCPAKAIKKDGVINPFSFRVNIAELEKVYDHIYPNSV